MPRTVCDHTSTTLDFCWHDTGWLEARRQELTTLLRRGAGNLAFPMATNRHRCFLHQLPGSTNSRRLPGYSPVPSIIVFEWCTKQEPLFCTPNTLAFLMLTGLYPVLTFIADDKIQTQNAATN